MYQGALDNFPVSWSPDSRWIAYSNGLDNRQNAIFLFDTQDKEEHQVTSGFYSDDSPVFSPDGKYLYFTSNRHFDPEYSNFDNSWIYNNRSEEHTSELQSLMRISYAVFCLKKTNLINKTN